MTEGTDYTDYTLQQLRDYIGDALGNENITPSQLVEAIETEIRDLLDYHQVSAGKAQKVLGLLKQGTSPDNVYSFDRWKQYDYEDELQDVITFGKYENQAAQPVDYETGMGFGKDILSFDENHFKLNSKFINKDNLNSDND
jgi:hypothetical protein